MQRNIRKKVRKEKERWKHNEYKEIEDLDKKYYSFNMHKKINELTGIRKNTTLNILKYDDGRIITDMKEKLLQWTNYIQNLFKDERAVPSLDFAEDTGPTILREEVIYAINNTK